MSRGAVMSLLRGDDQLKAAGALAGIDLVVVAEYDADQKPSDGAFIVVCWRITDYATEIQDNGPAHFELWAHVPVAKSTDFGRIDAMLDRCDAIFKAVNEDGTPVDGGDGRQLEQVGFAGRGVDITDEGYQTICKSAAYFAIGSKTAQ
ncbi:hypothetical protein [Mycobacterium sp. 1465703.0]|uniref:hypothetical protein n=1 Tax=Mycobacterium sp. 1465703.0 TaxID=1834078 RepID=UPI00080087F8|nr:hypothetical protein [Mycobacterium sp. 1465703.0]OBJ08282.1 hypothetical protein A5625_15300 [Mycobacterium sp. 1465703.0]